MNKHLAEHITKEDIQTLPLIAFEGDIHIIETEKECNEAIRKLQQEPAIGFDTETKPTFRKGEYNPTALIQLATETDAYLFRLNALGYPKSLVQLMESSDTLKLGISILDDLRDLKKECRFTPTSFLDLNKVAKEIGIKHIGVKKLAAICLEYRISKNQQTSNWENETLTEPQKKYAATDAWICLAIYHELQRTGYV
ncbi:MAG: 3'-5' exonuclease [Ekhidna sp.]